MKRPGPSALVLLAVAACSGSGGTAVPQPAVVSAPVDVTLAAPKPADKPEESAPDEPVAKPRRRAPRSAAPDDGSIGIAECDAYLATMQACAERNGPAAREAIRGALVRMRAAWQQAAATPEACDALRQSCLSAMQALADACG